MRRAATSPPGGFLQGPLMPHTVLDCPQNPTFNHIQDSLKRLESHSARTADAMEKMAANSATLDSHSQKLREHDTAFIEVFNWRREFVDKQDGDFRANLARIVELEKAQAVTAAVDHVVEEKEAKDERFWSEVKIKLLTPIITAVFFAIWIIDKMGAAEWLLKAFKEFNK